MAREATALRSLRSLSRQYPELQDIMFIIGDIHVPLEQSDRTTAIVAGALLDMFLELALRSRLVDLPEESVKNLFFNDGPLATMSARIALGYALGLFNEAVRDELTTLRHIRNAFAHNLAKITFDMPEVANVCARLNAPKWYPPDNSNYQRTPVQLFRLSSRVCWMILSACLVRPRRATLQPFYRMISSIYPELLPSFGKSPRLSHRDTQSGRQKRAKSRARRRPFPA